MKFELNGKEYTSKEYDFASMIELEKLGFDIESMSQKSFTTMAIIVAYNIGCDLKKASVEINEHLKKGGSLQVVKDLLLELSASPFFQTLLKK